MSTKKITETDAVKTENGAAKKAVEAVVYLGPDIKNIAINGTVYVNGLPEALKKKMEEVPAIRGLILPVSEFAAAGVEISIRGTALNNLYNAVSARLKEQRG